MCQSAIGRTVTAMIEQLPDMPPTTIGFRVAGEVEREDYEEVLAPEVRRAFETEHGRLARAPNAETAALRQDGRTVIKTSLSDEDAKTLQEGLQPPGRAVGAEAVGVDIVSDSFVLLMSTSRELFSTVRSVIPGAERVSGLEVP